ncbi:MAG: DNA repair protein RadC [Anaerolineae bacterium]
MPAIQSTFVIEAEPRPTRHLIRELPAGEQPINRLRHYGPAALSTVELVAAILQTPDALSLAQELLARFEDLAGLIRATLSELCTVNGIGPAKAAQLKATLELGRRLFVAAPEERPQITSPADAANPIMLDMGLLEQEQLWVILLNTKNYIVDIVRLYQGSTNASLVRVAEVFRDAIRRNCTAIIIAHNHPSSDPTPSPEDVRLTRQIQEAGQILDIELLDHLIIARHRWVSLKERGLGFD